jgi:NhaA family Na+:H+ antiporter
MEWTKLFKGFFDSERIGGLLLLFCTILSLAIANSDWGDVYSHFWHQKADLSFAGLKLNFSVEHWINDGLMTIFFLLVGLEIERELYAGELSTFSNAILPLAAALGGMLVPAAIHLLFNAGTPTQSGFGIPMATDIAFTLGMLALAGSRVPYSLKIFLTALAIIDDLGAILVIALFYSTGLQWLYLGISAAILGGLFLLSKLKVYKLAFYLIPGVVLWYCMMQSGIHPTIAGVLLAFVIPFSGNNETTPSYKLQHFLHKPVAYFIVPLFALANTGIMLKEGWLSEMSSKNSLGIMAGLVVGKPVGILLFCAMMIRFFKIKLPLHVRWIHLTGAAILAGIGFTMSIFISNLAFTNAGLVSYSKVAVLLGSSIATIIGLSLLLNTKPLAETEK